MKHLTLILLIVGCSGQVDHDRPPELCSLPIVEKSDIQFAGQECSCNGKDGYLVQKKLPEYGGNVLVCQNDDSSE